MTTKTATHTPGPWIVSDEDIVAVTKDRRAYVGRIDGRRVTSENDANARLIAAAPDMLSVCLDIIDPLVTNEAVRKSARAALAKVTGA